MTRTELRAALQTLKGELDRRPPDIDYLNRSVSQLIAECDGSTSYVTHKLRSLQGECVYLDGRSGDRESRMLTIRGELEFLLHYLAD